MAKIQVTAQQRANAVEALEVMWPSVPPKNVIPGLELFRQPVDGRYDGSPDCGTLACFGGWCVWWPPFREQGLRGSVVGSPYFLDSSDLSAAEILFGHPLMFAVRNAHGADYMDGVTPADVSDHQVVTNRLKWLIENSEVAG